MCDPPKREERYIHMHTVHSSSFAVLLNEVVLPTWLEVSVKFLWPLVTVYQYC